MEALLDVVRAWDSASVALGEALRWEPLTAFFLLVSAWWVKWPLFAAVGAACDLRRRRRRPVALPAVLCAVAAAEVIVTVVKEIVDRARPPLVEAGLDPVGAIPPSASFPSGHSATAFAAAVAVGLLAPRLRVPMLALAALVALSRVYLGMHYATDVLVGTALGVAIGLGAVWLVLRVLPRPAAPAAA